MTEAVATPTTTLPRSEIEDAIDGLELPLLDVRNVVHLLSALAASEIEMQPEALYPVHDALHRAHAAAERAYGAALGALRAAGGEVKASRRPDPENGE